MVRPYKRRGPYSHPHAGSGMSALGGMHRSAGLLWQTLGRLIEQTPAAQRPDGVAGRSGRSCCTSLLAEAVGEAEGALLVGLSQSGISVRPWTATCGSSAWCVPGRTQRWAAELPASADCWSEAHLGRLLQT